MSLNDDPDKKEIEIEVSPKKVEEENKNDFSEFFESFRNNANVDSAINYAKNNIQDTIAYILMFIGILLAIFEGFGGEVLVGLIVGFYFAKEIVNYIKDYSTFVREEGVARSIILAATLFVLFVFVPGIFIGAAIMTGIKVMLRSVK